MTSPPAGTAAAYLAGAKTLIAERKEQLAAWRAEKIRVVEYDTMPPVYQLADEVAPALVAALEAVLMLAETWESQTGHNTVTATVFGECAREIRSEVEAALSGAQGGNPE